MKPTLITLATSATLVIGAIALTPERPTITPTIIDVATSSRKVALPAVPVQGWMNSQGVTHTNSPRVYQMLVDEVPPTVDISQVSLQDVAQEFMVFLDENDVDTALNGKSANAIIIEKATVGIARNKKDKTEDNFTNP